MRPDFPNYLTVAVKALLNASNHKDKDLSLTAVECLNKAINSLMSTQAERLLLELFEEINKNASTKSLRIALTKFAELSHLLRPLKRKAFVKSLITPLRQICKRVEDESLQIALETSLRKICSSYGLYFSSANILALLKTGKTILIHSSSVVRRAACSLISSVCQYARSPEAFIPRLLHDLYLLSQQEGGNNNALQGVFMCLSKIIDAIVSRNDTHLLDFEGTIEHDVYHTLLRFIKSFTGHLIDAPPPVTSTILEAFARILQLPFVTSTKVLREGGVMRGLFKELFNNLLCFLLPYKSTAHIKVTVKTSSLTCLGLLYHAFSHLSTDTLESFSTCFQIIEYMKHEDPAVRGSVVMMSGRVLKNLCFPFNTPANPSNIRGYEKECQGLMENYEQLVNVIIEGLYDKYPATQKLSISATGLCFHSLLLCTPETGVKLAKSLIQLLSSESHWSVRLELLEVIKNMDFGYITYLENCFGPAFVSSMSFQQSILSLLLACLDDPVPNIRKKASNCLACSVTSLSFSNYMNAEICLPRWLAVRQSLLLTSFGASPADLVTANSLILLRKLVEKLYGFSRLDSAERKEDYRTSSLSGCYNAILEVTKKCGEYACWSINKQLGLKKQFCECYTDIILFSLEILSTSEFCTNIQLHALILDVMALVLNNDVASASEKLLPDVFAHLMCVLQVCASAVSQSMAQDIFFSSSKKFTNGQPQANSSEQSSQWIFTLRSNKAYKELFLIIEKVYKGSKIALNTEELNIFKCFIKSVLSFFPVLLDCSIIQQQQSYEKIVKCLENLFLFSPKETIQCVEVIISVLFSAEHTSAQTVSLPLYSHFYKYFYQESADIDDYHIDAISIASNLSKGEQNAHKNEEHSDKAGRQRLLRLFESLVLRAKQECYTSSDLAYHEHFLDLLIILINLRVNYSLLDHNSVFVDFLLKLLELIRSGHVKNPSGVVRAVARFFCTLLSSHTDTDGKVTEDTVLDIFLHFFHSSYTSESYSQRLYFRGAAVAGLTVYYEYCVVSSVGLSANQRKSLEALMNCLQCTETLEVLFRTLQNAKYSELKSLVSNKLCRGITTALKDLNSLDECCSFNYMNYFYSRP
ncbi:huntingtin-like [Zophobas morio]|uniref:huntingtin-like n=1 Tax=Zophobas morio TaxID=2755281 RepID=UPI003083A8AF